MVLAAAVAAAALGAGEDGPAKVGGGWASGILERALGISCSTSQGEQVALRRSSMRFCARSQSF